MPLKMLGWGKPREAVMLSISAGSATEVLVQGKLILELVFENLEMGEALGSSNVVNFCWISN